MKFRECDSINSQENVHAGNRNGSRIMCLQNSPKLWCRYEFIVQNHLGPSKTALEFENCKEELFTLTIYSNPESDIVRSVKTTVYDQNNKIK